MGTSTKLQNSVTGYNTEQTWMIVFSCDFWTVCEELVFLSKLEEGGKRKEKNSDLHFQSASSSTIKTVLLWIFNNILLNETALKKNRNCIEIRYHLSFKDLLSKQMNTSMKLNLFLPRIIYHSQCPKPQDKNSARHQPYRGRIFVTCEASMEHPTWRQHNWDSEKDIHGLPWWYTA